MRIAPSRGPALAAPAGRGNAPPLIVPIHPLHLHRLRLAQEAATPPMAARRGLATADSAKPPQPPGVSPVDKPAAQGTNGAAEGARDGVAAPVAAPHAAAATSEEVAALKEALAAQSRMLAAQQQTLDLLKGYMASKAPQSPLIQSLQQEDDAARLVLGSAAINDRRLVGLFDARYHSTSR